MLPKVFLSASPAMTPGCEQSATTCSFRQLGARLKAAVAETEGVWISRRMGRGGSWGLTCSIPVSARRRDDPGAAVFSAPPRTWTGPVFLSCDPSSASAFSLGDAGVLWAGRSWVSRLLPSPRWWGSQAHGSPLRGEAGWRMTWASAGAGEPTLGAQESKLGAQEMRLCTLKGLPKLRKGE